MEAFDRDSLLAFRDVILANYSENGRVLPWRETKEPWAVFLSEIMLQQTTVDRVIPYWRRFLHLWPTPAALAGASLESVLREWSGLGYNRRAKYLYNCALILVDRYEGLVPKDVEVLNSLPGIGAYTARAIACFAYGVPLVFIETNIRAVILHFFFHERCDIKDSELIPYVEATLDYDDPRRWYWALMDYGAALKKLGPNPARRGAAYAKQATFRGSNREARGVILKHLARAGNAHISDIAATSGIENERLIAAVETLCRDGLVSEKNGLYRAGEIPPGRP